MCALPKLGWDTGKSIMWVKRSLDIDELTACHENCVDRWWILWIIWCPLIDIDLVSEMFAWFNICPLIVQERPPFVFWFISVLVSLFWRMESGKSDGFPWEISSPGEKQKFPCEPSNILFRKLSEMSVGDERHCLSANIHPRLHLCCQHWNLLLWS